METDGQGAVTGKETIDPVGVNLGDSDPFDPPSGGGGSEEGISQQQMNSRYAQLLPASMGGATTCRLEGFNMGCGAIASLAATGLIAPGATPTVAAIYSNDDKRYVGFAFYNANAQAAGIGVGGANGFIPVGLNYVGGSRGFTGSADAIAQWSNAIWSDSWGPDTFSYDADGSPHTTAHSTGHFVSGDQEYLPGGLLRFEFLFQNGGFSRDEQEQVHREIIAIGVSAKCNKAFRKVGLTTPETAISSNGIVIGSSNLLYNKSAKELGLDEQTRHAYAVEFSSSEAQGATIRDINGVKRTLDGRPHIFLHPSAFAGASWLSGRDSLHDVLVHEFIHIGGQGITPGRLGSVGIGHDLSGYAHYDDILKACR